MVAGRLPRADVNKAIRQAQRQNADLAVRTVKLKARASMQPEAARHGPHRTGRRSMIEQYRSGFRENSVFFITNPTLRARIFEKGARPHAIFPRNRFLKFNRGNGTPFVYARAVASGHAPFYRNHPGQPARPVMAETMRELVPAFERNIAKELEKELSGGD